MKYILHFILAFSCAFALSGCSKKLLIGSGSKSNEPLLFNGEYTTKDLNPVQVDGRAIFGIPSFAENNRNNHQKAILFTFNGVTFGKTPRIFPILTLAGYTVASGMLLSETFGTKRVRIDGNWGSYYDYKPKLPLAPAMLLGLPIAGMANNLTWRTSALSGASQTVNYRLLNENPDVDLFLYPKYDVTYERIFSPDGIRLRYLFIQNASINARVTGASLIH